MPGDGDVIVSQPRADLSRFVTRQPRRLERATTTRAASGGAQEGENTARWPAGGRSSSVLWSSVLLSWPSTAARTRNRPSLHDSRCSAPRTTIHILHRSSAVPSQRHRAHQRKRAAVVVGQLQFAISRAHLLVRKSDKRLPSKAAGSILRAPHVRHATLRASTAPLRLPALSGIHSSQRSKACGDPYSQYGLATLFTLIWQRCLSRVLHPPARSH